MDIKRPVQKIPKAPKAPRPTEPKTLLPAPEPIEALESGLKLKRPFTRKQKRIFFVLVGIVGLIVVLLASGIIWYNVQLSPVGTNKDEFTKVTLKEGSSPAMIGSLLKEKNLIRDEQAFALYIRLNGAQNFLQAGAYRLSPAESTPEIVAHLKNGNVDTFDITFLPGATLEDNREVLIKAGYSEAEIDAAFKASYDSPLFATKPAKADLEGYIYGETYRLGSDATVVEILRRTFDTFAQEVEANDLVAKFKSHGLSLYEGITLASIIQREAVGGDEAQIAQVFYSRMAQGMKLGSDVTYQYIADKKGIPRDPNLNSPYNTRRFEGLPPGPISAPGLDALLAVAHPAKGDYLFFLSGDDNKTYYARTNEEHEKNIRDHCKEKCQIL